MNREIKTVMHEIKKRTIKVKETELLSPSIRKITFTSPELNDFISLSPDDHIKVFLEDGSMRDYTPLTYDNERQELSLAFFLHGNGPASSWAKHAKEGDTLNIGGPKGSRIVPYAYDWYLLIGDETAVPSFLRRLKEMPEDANTLVILEVKDESNIVDLKMNNNQAIHFVFRSSGKSQEENFLTKLNELSLPTGEFFTWISCEKATSRLLREEILRRYPMNESWIKSTGYWS